MKAGGTFCLPISRPCSPSVVCAIVRPTGNYVYNLKHQNDVVVFAIIQ